MTVYTRLKATATEKIEQFGSLWSFTAKSSGTFDPATASPSVSESSFQAYAIEEERTNEYDEETKTNIRIKLFAQVRNYGVGDSAEIDGDTYRVQRVDPIRPAGITIACYVWVVK